MIGTHSNVSVTAIRVTQIVGWEEVEKERGKNSWSSAKIGVRAINKLKNGSNRACNRPTRARNSSFVPKIPIFCANFVCETYAFGGNNSE